MNVILASKSPRRKEILETLGIDFTIVTADTNEHSTQTDPALLVEQLALQKATDVQDLLDAQEQQWVKEYNAGVYKTIAPLLTEEEAQWLKSKTL